VFGLVSKEQLVEIAELSIENLVKTFRQSPYFFYTESDFHCYLYHKIFHKLSLENLQYETKDKKPSILLHKEYPTKARYSAKQLKVNVTKGARGHFDLCIWNPDKTEERLFRATRPRDFEKEQHTFIAIEFHMIEGNDSLDKAMHHLRWDLLKLKSDKNKVEHGYALVFVRDWIHSEEFLEEIKREIAAENKITVLYTEKKGAKTIIKTLSRKHFNYWPMFK
jgi:hypothetical protein